MPESAWVILAVLTFAVFLRVIFFAVASTKSGGRRHERGTREDGAAPVGAGRPRPQNETRADETRK